MERLKLAVVGTGRVARDNYLPYLNRQSDVMLGFYNRTPAAAFAAAESFGGVCFPTLDALAAWSPTSVLVLTSEMARHEIGTALIERGVRRLFFEKPLVAAAGQANVSEQDFFDGKAMLELARKRGCDCAIMFNYRFFVHTSAAREIVRSRNFGRIVTVAVFTHYACWSHCIDLVRHFGGNFKEIAALQGPVVRRSDEIRTDAADVSAAFTMDGQATGTLAATAGAKWGHPLYELIMVFERGRIHLRDLDGALEVFDGRGGAQETRSIAKDRSRWDQYRDSFDAALAAYLSTLRAGSPPPVPAIEGLYELQVEAAMRRSIAQRRPVRLQEEFPI